MHKININKGFKLDYPDIFIPWGIAEDRLIILLNNKLFHVTDGYYTIFCRSLGGLEHELGFHFMPRKDGVLKELEFFRKNYEDQGASFKEFQEYLENNFGAPTKVLPGPEGYFSYEWQLEKIKIFHYIFNRFGLEEHMRIIKE